jgi:hypothetical protein
MDIFSMNICDSFEAFENALCAGSSFIAVTLAWRKTLPLADDREIVRAQQSLVNRHRERVKRAGLSDPLILSAFEHSHKLGLHGHLLMQVPGSHDRFLAAVERQLVREHGPLPPNFYNRDGRHQGRIGTPSAARGAFRYRMKSCVGGDGEFGIRRGVGLRRLGFKFIRISRGRA